MRTKTPTLGIDGNQWYLLDGPDMMRGSIEFGHTIDKVIENFERAYCCRVSLPNALWLLDRSMTPEEYKNSH